MRPWGSTWVASTTSRPAPELASMPRWVMCQSFAQPSSALYWHIGETTMRLASSTPASLIGENSEVAMRNPWWAGFGEQNETAGDDRGKSDATTHGWRLSCVQHFAMLGF